MKTDHIPFLVRVSCMTFNHAPFVKDAMNGFCMQETTFPFVCTIVDDFSSDGEQEVIMSYLDQHFDLLDSNVVRREETEDYSMTFAQHKTNKNCFFAVFLLKYNHFVLKKSKQAYFSEWSNTKYTARCEGDDYWTSPLKLQTQVAILDNHPTINIVVHNAIRIYPDGASELFNRQVMTGVYSLPQCLYRRWFTPTASFLYRNNFSYSSLWQQNGSNADMVFLYSNLLIGDLYYLSEVMSVYRYCTPHSLSMSTPKSQLFQKKIGMLRSINMLSENKYAFFTTPLIVYFTLRKWFYCIIDCFKNERRSQ